MAKKQFGSQLRRSSKIDKKPLDVNAAESVVKEEVSTQENPSSIITPTQNPNPEPPKPKVHRTSINFPFEVYDAMLEHTFRRRISMKDYLVNLIKTDLNLD